MDRVPFNAKFIRAVQKGMEKDVVTRATKLGLVAHSNLVQSTPVDYGQARAGWNWTLNRVDTSAPPRPTRVPAGESKVVLPQPDSKPDSPARVIGDAYHITNFVAHIVFLNEGTSVQAPPKFVEKSVALAVGAFK